MVVSAKTSFFGNPRILANLPSATLYGRGMEEIETNKSMVDVLAKYFLTR